MTGCVDRRLPRSLGVVIAVIAMMCPAVQWASAADVPVDIPVGGAGLFTDNLEPIQPDRALLALADVPNRPLPPQPTPLAELPPRAARAVARASELRALGRFTEATIELEKALRLAPDHPAVNRTLAVVHWEAGDFAAARRHASATLAGRPDDCIAHYVLGRLAARRFQNDEAISALRTALQCAPDPDAAAYRLLATHHLAEVLAAEGYLTAAIEMYETFRTAVATSDADLDNQRELALLLGPAAESAEERIARTHTRLGQHARAVELYGIAFAGQPPSADQQLTLAKALARAGRMDDAVNRARSALGRAPGAIEVVARIRQAQGDPAAIVADLEQASAAQPDNEQLATAYVAALAEFGEDNAAVQFLAARVATQPDDLDLRLTLFDTHLRAAKWTDAADVAIAAIEHHPAWSTDVGNWLTRLLDRPAALTALQARAASLVPTQATPAAAYTYGRALARAGDTPAAVAWLSAAVAQAADFTTARLALAELHLADFDWASAVRTARGPGDQAPDDSRLQRVLGDAYRAMDRTADAIRAYEEALRLNRTNSPARLHLAETLDEAGERPRALYHLQTLVEGDPVNERAREALFTALIENGQRRAAAEQLDALRKMAATPTTIARCATRLDFDAGDRNAETRLRETLQKAMTAHAPDAETLRQVARSFMRTRDYAAARARLDEARALDPRSTDTIELLMACNWLMLEFEDVLENLDILLGRYPHRLTLRQTEIELLLVLQRWEQAGDRVDQLRAREDLDPEVADVLTSVRIEIHRIMAHHDDAIRMLTDRWQKEPADDRRMAQLIMAYQDAGRHEQALQLILDWDTTVAGGYASGPSERIWQALPAADHDTAIHALLRAVDEDPANVAMHMRLMELLRAAGRFDDAVEFARAHLASGRHRLLYQNELFLSQEASGRFAEAIRTLEAMMTAPDSGGVGSGGPPIDLRYQLVLTLLQAEEYDKAMSKVTRWVQDASLPEEKFIYLRLLALCQQDAGSLQEAAQSLELALALQPDDVGISNDLGYTWADTGHNIERAEQLVRTAIAAQPRQAAYLDSLGWVKYKQGDFAAARKWLLLARFAADDTHPYAGDGEDPVVCQHLGDACWRMGEHAEAQRWWGEAMNFAEQRASGPEARPLDRATLTAVQQRLQAAATGSDPPLAPIGTPEVPADPPAEPPAEQP